MARVVFLGSPEFAVPSLEALARDPRNDVPLVVTQPDRPAGRGRRLQPPAVKVAAERLEIPVYQPESLRKQEAIDRLTTVDPDVIVVVSYGEILRRSVLELPPHGCLNVHPSLLPAYRGSTPIPAAILNGDPVTGVTIMRLVRQMDAGPIVSQRHVPLSGDETTGSLTEQLANEAAGHLPVVVQEWINGAIKEQPQDHSMATYTRELRKSDAQIDWSQPARYIERFVRAMIPWPRAWSTIEGIRLTINASRVLDEPPAGSAGSVTRFGDSVLVSTADGMLEILDVQPAGKKPMRAIDWYRGARLSETAAFDLPEEPRPPLIYSRES